MEKNFIAKKVEKMAPSGIRAFFDLVLGMKDVISLGVGEPDYVTPWSIREAGIFALEKGYTSYTSNKGLYKLRLYIHRYLKQNFGLDYCPDEEILITVGVSEGLDLAVRAVINPGEQVIIPYPSYVAYGPIVELAGGEPVFIPTDQKAGFKISAAQITRACTKKTKALLLNYPANPTGVTYSKSELQEIESVCSKNNLLVITDEIYGELTYEGTHVLYPSLKGAKAHTIHLNGFSKAYAMTGWRVGYACGPASVISAMTKIHQYTMLCVPIMSQMAACEALQTGKHSIEEMKKEYHRRRDFIVDSLNDMGLDCLKPQGAFYVFPSIKKCSLPVLEFAQRLLKEEKVAVVPGTAFGESFVDNVRMSYAADYNQLKEAMSRIKKFIDRCGCKS